MTKAAPMHLLAPLARATAHTNRESIPPRRSARRRALRFVAPAARNAGVLMPDRIVAVAVRHLAFGLLSATNPRLCDFHQCGAMLRLHLLRQSATLFCIFPVGLRIVHRKSPPSMPMWFAKRWRFVNAGPELHVPARRAKVIADLMGLRRNLSRPAALRRPSGDSPTSCLRRCCPPSRPPWHAR
jgi:hypothetical protein